MVKQFLEQKEKKVEYVELIYDLIFVFIIGRNNALLHHTENGFITFSAFVMYAICTLAVIQIWNYTTYYINGYGRHSVRDHVFLFINMFLMYFLAVGTRCDWQNGHTMYHIAWALILLNIGAQYLIERRHHKGDAVETRRITRMTIILFCEAALVALAMLEFELNDSTYTSLGAILFGIASVMLAGRDKSITRVDFEHLSERAMLYVVFTFGEMIIAIATYFDGNMSVRDIYFALMGFLIVVGLFLSYGVIYDHMLDRERQTNGLSYMFIHIFLIFSLNNITSALEFMRDEDINLIEKMSFMVGSILIYFAFLFATSRYAKRRCHMTKGFVIRMVILAVVFAVLMFLFREVMLVNIALTVVFVFTIFLVLYLSSRKMERDMTADNHL